MAVYRVPLPEWPAFCERLTALHRGGGVSVWLTRVPGVPGGMPAGANGAGREVSGTEGKTEDRPAGGNESGDDWEMLAGNDVRLHDLRVDVPPGGPGTRPDIHPDIHIDIELATGARRAFVLSDARDMQLEQHGEKETGLLRIEAGDRAMLVCFDEPVFPGIPDGLP